jgi:exodeoxyribonuclease VII large subunit
MPETINDRKVFTLLEVARSISRTLAERYTNAFWVKAELLKLNHYPQSGHCYPDLVEKTAGKVVAQVRSLLWKSDYQKINRRFLDTTGEPLKDGINILFQARIQYDPVHGLSLQILDIDPGFTMGEMLRQKLENIKKLKEEGLFDRNKTLAFPLLPKRVAVISVETSKGYADFRKKIDGNPFGFHFFYMLFPSLLQGDGAVPELKRQLNRIRKVKDHFDVVAIIRGGGGDLGLSCYDNYELAREVALFPLPVLAGIGHSTNETVVQMVAHQNNITPTDLADYLIRKFTGFKTHLDHDERVLREISKTALEQREKEIKITSHRFSGLLHWILEKHHQLVSNKKNMVRTHTSYVLKSARISLEQQLTGLPPRLRSLFLDRETRLKEMEKQMRLLDPKNILKRGYSITWHNQKPITNHAEVNHGDRLLTELYAGEIESIVESSDPT